VAKRNTAIVASADESACCSSGVRSTISAGVVAHPDDTHPGDAHPYCCRVEATDVCCVVLGLKCLPPFAKCEQMRSRGVCRLKVVILRPPND
jgi:hypothetical protein